MIDSSSGFLQNVNPTLAACGNTLIAVGHAYANLDGFSRQPGCINPDHLRVLTGNYLSIADLPEEPGARRDIEVVTTTVICSWSNAVCGQPAADVGTWASEMYV